jgi:hypothetical protein
MYLYTYIKSIDKADSKNVLIVCKNNSYLQHGEEGGDGGRAVEGEFANVDLHDGERLQLGPADEHEEEDERDDGEHEGEDADEEALVRPGAVHRVVVRRAFDAAGVREVDVLRRQQLLRLALLLADVLPHDVEDGRADQAVLDGAREEERARVLHQRTHDVGASALVDVVRPLQAPSHSVQCCCKHRRKNATLLIIFAIKCVKWWQNLQTKKGS